MTTKLLLNGELKNIGAGAKALTLPSWAVEWMANQEGGGETLYKKSSWAYSCINIRSDAIAGIPWAITRNGEVIEGETEPGNLLHFISDFMNWNDLMRATEADLNITAKAFWLKVGSKTGSKIAALQRINPGAMSVVGSPYGIERFEMTISGKVTRFDPDEIVYFRLYDPNNDFGGISPLEVAADDILAEAYSDAYLKSFFKNNAMPATIVNFRDTSIDAEQLRQYERRWYQRFRGLDKAHRTAFTSGEGGLDVATIGYSIQELAMSDVREEARRAICAAFRVPMPLAGASESANYATMKEQRASLYTETVLPRADYMAGVINAELIEKDFPGYGFAFQYNQIEALQDMVLDKSEAIAKLVTSGTITPLAGALMMGFEESDVGAGPVRGITFPESNTADKTKVVKDPSDDKIKVVNEIAQYKKYRTKRIGQDAARPFEFKHMPETLVRAIDARLDGAETAQDVTQAFESAVSWVGYP